MRFLIVLFLSATTTFAAEHADVVVVGATPAGIATTVAAAQSGARVIVIEESSNTGGIIAHDPFQLPYRIMVPQCVDGLLVPVACSASPVAHQTLRMEPVFITLGEACGIAAVKSQESGAKLRSVDVKSVQREIINRGGVILFENTAIVPDDL